MERRTNHHPGGIEMYGLVPGQDWLFVNTILLRLAYAFLNGDNIARRRILDILLIELKRIMKKGRNYEGILVKGRVLLC